MADQQKILVIDDEAGLRELVRINLEHDGYGVIQASDALEGLEMVQTQHPDMVILDIMMPDMDGLEACRRLREFSAIPVLMLTARVQSKDVVTGLDSGADDYMLKPFHFDELHARVQAILRRNAGFADRILAAGTLVLDIDTRQFSVGEAPLEISVREGELLELLMRRLDKVVPKRMLEDQLFGSGDALGSNAVEVYIHRIRRHLKQAGVPLTVQTVRGVGYMLLSA